MEEEKDTTADNLTAGFLAVFIILMIVFLFCIYGGQPQGLYWRHVKFEEYIKAEIEKKYKELREVDYLIENDYLHHHRR